MSSSASPPFALASLLLASSSPPPPPRLLLLLASRTARLTPSFRSLFGSLLDVSNLIKEVDETFNDAGDDEEEAAEEAPAEE